jgi:hypothetical protein
MDRQVSEFVGHTLQSTRQELIQRNAGVKPAAGGGYEGNFRAVFNTNDPEPGPAEDTERRMADVEELPHHTQEQKNNIRSVLASLYFLHSRRFSFSLFTNPKP